MNKRGLGKGLGALIPETEERAENSVMQIKVTEVIPNEKQPRRHFSDEALKELSESIKEHGVVQPIIVQKVDGGYGIIAGERRWRASRLAGLKAIPAIVKDCSNVEVMEIALIENLQREDLNAMEEAYAYRSLMEEYKMTQEEIAKRIGKSRPAIANSLRLVNLPDRIKTFLMNGNLSAGHARALLAIEGEKKQLEIAERIIEQQLNVRQVEKLAQEKEKSTAKASKSSKVEIEIKEIEERLMAVLGTKVMIRHKKGKGTIEIEYYSNEELDRIIEFMEK